eukprot:CAMPEP_0195539194 /NCGR_PEP_ID=MMETSP0794_2-20130614/49928_1 /TAXON_ID=515487 /ORGANISM="Stephanopyxis turris, Strain CCMP 815" /LENGTH=321 /DNA_ID=CAMNT_0040673217 /DNA_START=494 /DNA_END=1459 /DNA_ORIENTATION=+
MPFSALFNTINLHGRRKFEASDITVLENNGRRHAYVVHDSLWALSRIDLESMIPLSPRHVQVESDVVREGESDYEGLFHHDSLFYAIRESIEFNKKGDHRPLVDKGYHAVIEELDIADDDGTYSVLDSCPSEFTFETYNKGLEGVVGVVDDKSGELHLLGLCEANDCKKSHQDKPGNGKILVMKKIIVGDACVWKTVNVLSIPDTAMFHDYSAIAIKSDGTVAISSQEDSALWIGKLTNTNDASKLAFDESFDGRVYRFPVSNDGCDVLYCNVEGLYFLSDDILVGVSDKMKSKGKQHGRCLEKDQSIHLFALPYTKGDPL